MKPAAINGVIPPPIMQYSPSDNKAESLLHTAQFKGSLWESSGWGSRMIWPSCVVFLSSATGRGDSGLGTPVGSDECEVLAGAFLKPSGSLRPCASSKTEPELFG